VAGVARRCIAEIGQEEGAHAVSGSFATLSTAPLFDLMYAYIACWWGNAAGNIAALLLIP
jgi:hypothetical protein